MPALTNRSKIDWRNVYWNGERKKYVRRTPGDKLPTPKRIDVFNWFKKFWSEFPNQVFQNSSTATGYFYEDGIDYSGETESEIDA